MEYNLNSWTDLKESNTLVSAGLKPDTADLVYLCDENGKMNPYLGGVEDEYKDLSLPCWSLGRLIDLMPKRIGLFTLVWNISSGVIEYRVDIDSEHTDRLVSKFDIPSMMIWLLENGYMDDYKI